MQYINVETTEGIKRETAYSIHDFPYYELQFHPTCRKGKRTTYYNIPSAFDIETTTEYKTKTVTEKIKGKEVTREEVVWQRAYMYQWQYCILDKVVFGRTWEEFQTFIKKVREIMNLSSGTRLVTYVHSLAYEFQFTKDFIEIDQLFAKEERKPLKFLSDGIEFRCSYFLSNMSLAKFCENYGATHYKLVDTYDYKKLRTPTTPLTNDELAYCYNDVRGLCQCITKLLETDNMATIPLTNTGFVRREFRNAMASNKRNRIQFEKISLSPQEYKMLKRAFRGGNTHASRYFTNQIINNVFSFDIQSSYPACMMLDNYPIGKFSKVTLDTQEKLDKYCKNTCVVMDVEFSNLRVKPKQPIPYIDIGHLTNYHMKSLVNDNGRVLSCDYATITLTNIDLDIIRRTYDYDYLIVNDAMYAQKGQLPLELLAKLLEFYEKKTTLKDVLGKEYEYMKSKNQVNAAYGMLVSALVHNEIIFTDAEWETITADIDENLSSFYNSRNNFLSYQWGVFVTANARKRLQDMIDVVGIDIIYIDTDSIKFINEKHVAEFEEKNKELIEDCSSSTIPAYADKDGKRYYLGIWDKDGVYKRFKTLGAKKYCDEKFNKKGELVFEITVSGMSKSKGAKAVGSIENFNIDTTFHDIGRTTSWYNDCSPHYITVNGDKFLTSSNIGVVETTYKLGVTDTYEEVFNSSQLSFNNF